MDIGWRAVRWLYAGFDGNTWVGKEEEKRIKRASSGIK
jgi:hypothetical protein